MKPLIKWVGGKRRFLKLIDPEITEYNNYYEPFAGSAALYFKLMPKNSAYINDLNSNLINFYAFVKSDYLKLRELIVQMIDNHNNKEDYYKIRKNYNDTIDEKTIENAAMFFYLNKVGFNGIYRVNLSGKFNVPKGNSIDPCVPTIEEFKEANELLKRAKLSSKNYSEVITNVKKGDLIYLDPPYYPDETSKFTGYTDPRFMEKEHIEMVQNCRKYVDAGAKVIISNSASKNFEKIIDKNFKKNEWKVEYIQTKRSINPNAANKNRFMETLYVLKGEE